MISIERRIRTSLILSLLTAFMVLAVLADYGVKQLSRDFVTTRLQHDSDNLIRALTLTPDGEWQLDVQQLPLIYQRVRSGHYFQVLSGEQRIRSRSLWDRTPGLTSLPAGAQQSTLAFQDDEHWLIWHLGIELRGRPVTLWVAEDIAPFEQQWRYFSIILYAAMVTTLVLLVLLQRYLLRRSFRQLGELRQAIRQLQQGEIESLSAQVPVEIQPLTEEINHLLQRLEQRIVRSRTAMGNLAHELKRSLQRLHLLRDELPESAWPECDQALDQIRRLTERELKRARIAGSPHPGRRFSPHEDLPHLVEVLRRIYPEITIITEINGVTDMACDRDDMLELIGNLLDNACKFGASRVRLELSVKNACYHLRVSDNGPGLPESINGQLPERGVQIDESVSGHGLGLSICRMITDSYQGDIRFRQPSPGTECPHFRVEVTIPLSVTGADSS